MDKGINARITDKLVWDKIAGLMSSRDLMLKQINRWMNADRAKIRSSIGDIKTLEKEVIKLKGQEDRYNKAYGAGLYSIEQLKEYVIPLKDRIASLEIEIAKARQEENQIDTRSIPTQNEIKAFAKKATTALENLSFDAKRAIIMNVLDKVIGSQENLEVHGFLPISSNYVTFESKHRHRGSSECG